MKLEELHSLVQKRYDLLTPEQILKGLELVAGIDCNNGVYRCHVCLIIGECYPKENRKIAAKKKLLKVMTGEELQEKLFDYLL